MYSSISKEGDVQGANFMFFVHSYTLSRKKTLLSSENVSYVLTEVRSPHSRPRFSSKEKSRVFQHAG